MKKQFYPSSQHSALDVLSSTRIPPNTASTLSTITGKYYKPVFSITRSKKFSDLISKSVKPQLFFEEACFSGDTLPIKEIRKLISSAYCSGIRTQPTTPNQEELKTDSYKFKEKLKEKSNMIITEESTLITKPVFKASVLYGYEMAVQKNPYLDQVMNEYILHASQSIGIIKRLKEVPSHLIEMKRVNLDENDSKFACITNRKWYCNIRS